MKSLCRLSLLWLAALLLLAPAAFAQSSPEESERVAREAAAKAQREADVAAQQQKEMIDKSGQMGVPVIDIDGKITVGFDEAELAQALGVK